MRSIRALAAVVMACGLLTVGAVSATADETCPPYLAGHWVGTTVSDQGGGSDLVGDIGVTDNEFSGPLNAGGFDGLFDGTATCASIAGTFTSTITVTFSGTIAVDGRTITGTYSSPIPDTGTFTLAISSPDNAAAAGGTEVFEGNAQPGSTSAAGRGLRVTANATPVKATPRVVNVPVTLTTASSRPTVLHYRLVGDTATVGQDFTDNGLTHTLKIAAHHTVGNVPVTIIPNNTRQGDRALHVELLDGQAFARVGTLTILDDD